jgi:hypothetical protein
VHDRHFAEQRRSATAERRPLEEKNAAGGIDEAVRGASA